MKMIEGILGILLLATCAYGGATATVVVYDVTQSPYSAAGDGSTDDTSAIQDAIDDANDAGGGTVYFPTGVYKITETIYLHNGIKLQGEWDKPYRINAATTTNMPQITMDPNTSGDNAFEHKEAAVSGSYIYGISINGLSFEGQSDGTSGDCFHLDNPAQLTIDGCVFNKFECPISITGGMAVVINRCFIHGGSSDADAGIEFRDETTTTSWVMNTHITTGFNWGIRAKKTLGLNLICVAIESCDDGGIDMYELCNSTTLVGCYMEDIPEDGGADPMIQVGVNGTGGASYDGAITIIGGEFGGYNDGSHDANSSFINADLSGSITINGAVFRRVGKFIKSTANTHRIDTFGIHGVSVTDWVGGFYDTSKWVGVEGSNSPGTRIFRTGQRIQWGGSTYDQFMQQSGSILFWGAAGQANHSAVHYDGRWVMGDTSPVTDAQLALNSTTKAFLPPRMTTTQRNALTATNGMVIYNTTNNQLECYENGSWVDL